ncbi:MAG: SMC-Scp complex subunit ScpB [Cyanobacteria bacterium REEB65]|nr:SMC-Scp complex subunit ScpB [Cyanobacteria bacterium REEB65]
MSKAKVFTPQELQPIVEAALFTTASPLSLAQLADLVSASQRVTAQALAALAASYDARPDGALEIGQDEEGYILQVKPLYQRVVDRLLPSDLPQSTLRTLSLIAAREPVMQREVVDARGSSAYDHVKELVERGLVKKTAKGNSFELTVGPRFAEYFRIDRDKVAPTLERLQSRPRP